MSRGSQILLLGCVLACARNKATREVVLGGNEIEAPSVPTADAESIAVTASPTLPPRPTVRDDGAAQDPGELKGSCLLPEAEGICQNHYARYPADSRGECQRKGGRYTEGSPCSESGMTAKCRSGFPGLETLYFPANPSFRTLESARMHCQRFGGRIIAP